MEPFTLYLLKVNGIFSLLFVFYLLFLHRDTFYKAKRAYLLGIMFVSAFLPLLRPAALIPQKEGMHYVILLVGDSINSMAHPERVSLNTMQLINLLLYTGIFVCGVFLLFRFAQLAQAIRQCRVMYFRERIIYIPAKEVNPFSFNGKIYLNPELYTHKELAKIVLHEQAHIDQKHGVDLMLMVFFQSLVWMNPLYYWFLRSAHENIEFLADQQVLRSEQDTKAYQYALLKVAQHSSPPMTQHFNMSHLKKRIIMMNKKRTHTVWSGKYLLTLPLLLVIILLVNAPELKAAWANADFSSNSISESDTTPADSIKQINQVKHEVIVIRNHGDSSQVNPLILVDGKKITREELKQIDPNMIDKMEVFKDSMAIAKFGNAGKNGVIVITKKTNGSTDVKSLLTMVEGKSITKSNTDVQSTASAEAKSNFSNTRIIIDGVYSSKEVMDKLSPSEIANISILKGRSATDLYGDYGKNGTIIINTKRYSNVQDSPVKEDVMSYIEKQRSKKLKLVKIEGRDNQTFTKGINDKNTAIFIDGQLADLKALQRLDYSKIQTINTDPISNFPELAIKYNLRKERIVQVFTK